MSTETAQPLLPAVKKSEAPRPQIRLFNGYIILNPTISKLNFAAFFLFTFYLTTILVPVALLQSPLLTNIYHLSLAEQSTLNTIITSIQIVIQITCAPFLGIMNDKHGRKPFLLIGIGLNALGTVALPNLPAVYPYFVIVSLLKGIGLMFIISSPLLADYIDYETKGRVAGMNAVLAYTGMFFSTLLNENTDFKKDIVLRYYEFGAAGFVIGILLTLGLKGGDYHKKLFYDKKLEQANKQAGLEGIDPSEVKEMAKEIGVEIEDIDITPQDNVPLIVQEEEEPETLRDVFIDQVNQTTEGLCFQQHQVSLNDSVADSVAAESAAVEAPKPEVKQSQAAAKVVKPTLKAGLREANNPWIFTGFVCGFLSSAKLGLSGLNLINLVISFSGDPDQINQAYTLLNRQTLAALISAFFFGVIADKYNKFKLIVTVLFFAVAGDLLLILMPAPDHFTSYLGIVFFGISSAGFMTFVSQLISKYAKPQLRASVMAVSGVFGVFGTIFTSIVGLYLNRYDPRIPFYMFLATTFIGFCLLIGLYCKKKHVLNSTY